MYRDFSCVKNKIFMFFFMDYVFSLVVLAFFEREVVGLALRDRSEFMPRTGIEEKWVGTAKHLWIDWMGKGTMLFQIQFQFQFIVFLQHKYIHLQNSLKITL